MNVIFKNQKVTITIQNAVVSEIRKQILEIKFQNQSENSFLLRGWLNRENNNHPPIVELDCDLGIFSGSFGKHRINGKLTTMEFGYLIKND